MVTLPEQLAPIAREKQIENIFFKKHLRNFSSKQVDEITHQLYHTYSKQIDCTACGNCCKQLEPGLMEEESGKLAELLNLPLAEFITDFTATDGTSRYLKTKPCIFLNADCTCKIYTQRPQACAGYPHLDSKDIKYKKSVWDNYTLCPIVFNVLEGLKKELGFTYGK